MLKQKATYFVLWRWEVKWNGFTKCKLCYNHYAHVVKIKPTYRWMTCITILQIFQPMYLILIRTIEFHAEAGIMCIVTIHMSTASWFYLTWYR